MLTACARKVVAAPREQRSWIVCDGDIDPDWIEALNSVLDDNRLLTMPHGERIQFAHNVNFIFECHSLESASPATVSRCGVIHMGAGALASPRMALRTQPAMQSSNMSKTVMLLQRCMQWLQDQPDALGVAMSARGILANALSQISVGTSGARADAALACGFAANLRPVQRDSFMRDFASWANIPGLQWAPPGNADLLAQLQRNAAHDAVGHLSSSHDQSSQLVMVDEAKAALHCITPWLQSMQPFIMCGERGAGKGAVLRAVAAHMPGVTVAELACNAQTQAAHAVSKLIQVCTGMGLLHTRFTPLHMP